MSGNWSTPCARRLLKVANDSPAVGDDGVSIAVTGLAVPDDSAPDNPDGEVETLDLEHLTNTIRAIAAGAKTIVDGDATPTRVDPEDV